MTTEVVVTVPVPTKNLVRVEVLVQPEGELYSEHYLKEGEHAKFYLHSKQTLCISEYPAPPKP